MVDRLVAVQVDLETLQFTHCVNIPSSFPSGDHGPRTAEKGREKRTQPTDPRYGPRRIPTPKGPTNRPPRLSKKGQGSSGDARTSQPDQNRQILLFYLFIFCITVLLFSFFFSSYFSFIFSFCLLSFSQYSFLSSSLSVSFLFLNILFFLLLFLSPFFFSIFFSFIFSFCLLSFSLSSFFILFAFSPLFHYSFLSLAFLLFFFFFFFPHYFLSFFFLLPLFIPSIFIVFIFF
ncbi:unnamed protein product [Acanthosepion pharaonis]|uniref:Uncharacterized protein n=1 Tax=Acanthosepion pharaonis TaxID=158019 RepID=A0A812C5Y5_ACAPH|nr:unnamed protein product [Sepia pharaonis]